MQVQDGGRLPRRQDAPQPVPRLPPPPLRHRRHEPRGSAARARAQELHPAPTDVALLQGAHHGQPIRHRRLSGKQGPAESGKLRLRGLFRVARPRGDLWDSREGFLVPDLDLVTVAPLVPSAAAPVSAHDAAALGAAALRVHPASASSGEPAPPLRPLPPAEPAPLLHRPPHRRSHGRQRVRLLPLLVVICLSSPSGSGTVQQRPPHADAKVRRPRPTSTAAAARGAAHSAALTGCRRREHLRDRRAAALHERAVGAARARLRHAALPRPDAPPGRDVAGALRAQRRAVPPPGRAGRRHVVIGDVAGGADGAQGLPGGHPQVPGDGRGRDRVRLPEGHRAVEDDAGVVCRFRETGVRIREPAKGAARPGCDQRAAGPGADHAEQVHRDGVPGAAAAVRQAAAPAAGAESGVGADGRGGLLQEDHRRHPAREDHLRHVQGGRGSRRSRSLFRSVIRESL